MPLCKRFCQFTQHSSVSSTFSTILAIRSSPLMASDGEAERIGPSLSFQIWRGHGGRFRPILKQKSKLEDKGGGRGGGERGNLPPIKRLNCAPVKLYPAQFNRLQSVRPLLKSDLRWQPPDLDSSSAQSLNPEKKSGKEDRQGRDQPVINDIYDYTSDRPDQHDHEYHRATVSGFYFWSKLWTA